MRALIYLGLLGFTSFFLTLSSLPLYAVQGGVSSTVAGLVTTVMLASTVAAQLLVPKAIQRFGQPAVLVFGLIAIGAPTPLLLLDNQLWWLLLWAVVRGWGFAVLTVCMPVLATQITPVHRHGAAIGLYGLAIAAPNLIAVPLSVALTTAELFPIVAVLGASPLLALPLVRHFPTPPVVERKPDAAPVGPFPLRAIVGLTAVLLVVTMIGGGFTVLPVQLPTGSLAAVTLMVFGLTGALSRWRVGTVADRIGPRLPLLLVLLTGALGLASAALGIASDGATRYTLVVLGGALFGVCYGGVQNLTLLLTFTIAGPDHRNPASAVWNATYDTGTAIGALLLGAAAGGLGLDTVLLAAAGLVVVMLLPAARAARRR